MNPFCIPFAITNMAGALLAMDLGFMGPNYSISTACATGNYCILRCRAAASRLPRSSPCMHTHPARCHLHRLRHRQLLHPQVAHACRLRLPAAAQHCTTCMRVPGHLLLACEDLLEVQGHLHRCQSLRGVSQHHASSLHACTAS